jgi:branched-chain amino acid transport system permease protein
VHFGYTGLLNFGQAGFMAVAAYAMTSIVTTWGLSLWLGLVVGLLLSVVLALLLGVPTLRLRADYLAIVTIAAAEIIRQTVGSATLVDHFGGQDGLTDFIGDFRALNPFTGDFGISGFVTWRAYDFFVMVVGWVVVALSCLVVWLLMRSPWGRVLKSIREDEDAVRSLGKNVYAYKMQSLIIGGLFGALAGFFKAFRSAAINPSFFATDITFYAYTVLLIGGAARVFGPVVGSIILWFLLTFLGEFFAEATAGANPVIPESIMNSNQASLMRFIFLGLGLMLLMIFRPQGIFGDRKELALDAR